VEKTGIFRGTPLYPDQKSRLPQREGGFRYSSYFLMRRRSGTERRMANEGMKELLQPPPPPEDDSADVVKLRESDHSEYAPFESLKRTRQ